MLTQLLMTLAAVFVVNCQHLPSSRNCNDLCHRVQTEDGTNGRSQFHEMVMVDGNKETYRMEWSWRSIKDTGLWDVFYTYIPSKGVKSGGFNYALPLIRKTTNLNWTLFNKTLTWASQKGEIPPTVWNATICGSGIPMDFSSNGDKWTFRIGNTEINEGESGGVYIDERTYALSSDEANSKLIEPVKRKKREAEDMEEDKKNVWNKLKKWFKELFDQGPDDPRGWMTRIADWILGLLERILS